MGWAVLFGMGYWLIKKDAKGSLVVGILVLSHWVLDLVMHRPDLPLYPGDSPKVGLGLWNSVPMSLVLELLLLALGVAFYIRATTPLNKKGHYGFWALVIFLLVIHFMNFFGPVPASTTEIAWAGQLQWLLVAWGWWVDRNRGDLGRQAAS